MKRPTYSIRKGFEYQDLYCALELLELIETRDLQGCFQIESDEIDHINDLLLKPSAAAPIAHQVRFHTTQQYCDTFESFTRKSREKSRSLLQKLYKGWRQLSNKGETQCEVRFISSNPAEPKPGKLGSAIDTENGKINTSFFSKSRFAKARKKWCQDLGIDTEELRRFLDDVIWQFAFKSIAELRRDLAERLKRIGFPYGTEAVALFVDIVSKLATQEYKDITVTELIHKLWEYPTFRETCEQVFPEIIPGLKSKQRASILKVAAISIEALPAFISNRFACIEEPVPQSDYKNGITAPLLAGIFDDLRGQWRSQYISWQRSRLLSILDQLTRYAPDVVVFPRLSVPFELANEIYQWGAKNTCNVIMGGQSFNQTSRGSLVYEEVINVHIKENVTASKPDSDLIIDVVLRHDRAGRYTISEMQSPYSKSETIKTELHAFELPCRNGWLTAVSLSSPAAIKEFMKMKVQPPELIICSCNIHGNLVYDKLTQNPDLINIPLVFCSSSLNLQPTAAILNQDDSLITSDRWEGVMFAEINYSRSSAQKWTATIKYFERMPIVYHDEESPSTVKEIEIWSGQLRGFPASVIDARSQQHSRRFAEKIVVLTGEDPGSFFYQRADDADRYIRDRMGSLEPEQMKLVAGSLAKINESKREYEFCPLKPRPPKQTTATSIYLVRQPILLDRTNELRTINRFVERANHRRLLFIYGPPGIGKRALLSDVQHKGKQNNEWLRIRCVKDADLAETLGQILITLGVDCFEPPPLNLETYDRVWSEISRREYQVVVFEDAHNLPIGEDDQDHPELLAFLSDVCRRDFGYIPRAIFVSEWRGDLTFSGSHLLQTLRIPGLEDAYIVRLLQEYIASRPSMYLPPSTTELEQVARKIHGYPILAEIVAFILEESSVGDVIETLHEREEVRDFIIHRLLGRAQLSDIEKDFLSLAATFRIPVHRNVFAHLSGARSREIIEDLADRFLLGIENSKIKLHPLLADHFTVILADYSDSMRLHRIAYDYFEKEARIRRLTLDERIERVYHGTNAHVAIPLEDIKLMVGPLRTALFSALAERDWQQVNSCAERILQLFPRDPVARVTKAVSLDATGQYLKAEEFSDSVSGLGRQHMWVGLEFAKSRIRRRDFDGAERVLSELEQRFGTYPRIQVARAQFFEAQGLHVEAIETCEEVLTNPYCREKNAFYAGLILRHANRAEPLIEYVDTRCAGLPGYDRLLSLFSYFCVITNYAPDEGIRTLAQMWNDNPRDGGIIADYAAALMAINRNRDAKRLLEKGLKDCHHPRQGRHYVLVEYVKYLDSVGKHVKAHEHYRELIKRRQHDLHIRRRFAESLIQAAAVSRSRGEREFEDACIEKAKKTLQKLLEIAPKDKWASDQLHRVEQRVY